MKNFCTQKKKKKKKSKTEISIFRVDDEKHFWLFEIFKKKKKRKRKSHAEKTPFFFCEPFPLLKNTKCV